MTNETIDDVVALRAKYDEALAGFNKDSLAPRFKRVFEAFRNVAAITWNQHTPYFNDGEPCVFGVGDIWLLDAAGLERFIEEGNGYAEEYSIEDLYDWRDEKAREEHKAKMAPITDIPDDIMAACYGDHVFVVVKRDGTVEVEDYEHD